MENNSIDDLFKKGLAHLERTPSAEAWQRIEQREHRAKTFGWVWYVAAGITVALMAGYVAWRTGASELKPSVADQVIMKTNVPEVPLLSEKEAPLSVIQPAVQEDVDLKGVVQKTQIPEREILSSVPQENSTAVEEISRALPESEAIIPVHTEIQTASVSIAATPSVKPEDITEAPSRTIVVNVSPVDTLDHPKVSRFARVFRQLKNVRAGERVDWDEVGFNPRQVLARVDSRHKQ